MNCKKADNKLMPKTHQLPCSECVNTELHCCNRFPLFRNEELAELIDSGYLNEIKKPVRIIRYRDEVYTTLNLEEDMNTQIKEIREGRRACMFFEKGKGCILPDKYMPLYCKKIRDCGYIIRCAFCGMSEEQFKSSSLDELKAIKTENAPNILAYDRAFAEIFSADLGMIMKNRPVKKQKKKRKNQLKYTKDELIFLLAFHSILENKDFLKEKGIMEVQEKKRLFIEPDGTITISKELKFVSLKNNAFLKNFLLKLTNLSRITLAIYRPEKQSVIEAKVNQILKGMHNYGKIDDEKLRKNYYGLLFAIVLMYYYKEKYKMKSKEFKGVFQFSEFSELGDYLLDLIAEEGKDEVAIMEEITEFADTFIKRVIKETI